MLVAAIACTSKEESPASGTSAGTGSSASSASGAAKPGRGRELYKANCVACHGEGGKGDGPGAGVLKPPPRDHTDRAYMSTLPDQEVGEIIKIGGAIKGKPGMPSHPQISGDDLAALVAYVRSLSQP
ncbi:MAG: cytochrome c [Acidobacteriota bacterium]|nr:cytochrome c [Acidobacteriota bacterium]MDP2390423.1 cytochrome c [Acidobacteriota bacterium]